MATKEMATKLTLPTEPTDGRQEWIKQRIVLIGKNGVGKSGLMSHAAAGLYLDSEGNLAHLKVKRLPCRSTAELRQIIPALQEAQPFPYDTIILDTIDKVVESMEADVIAWGAEKFTKVDVNSIGDIPNGAGYAELGKRMSSMLDVLDALPACIVVVTHPKTIKVESPTAATYDAEGIALYPSVAQRLLGWSHHNLHIQSEWRGDKFCRIVKTQPERGHEGKSHGGIVPHNWAWETADLKAEFTKLRGLFV